jgi:hypothetical protein
MDSDWSSWTGDGHAAVLTEHSNAEGHPNGGGNLGHSGTTSGVEYFSLFGGVCPTFNMEHK